MESAEVAGRWHISHFGHSRILGVRISDYINIMINDRDEWSGGEALLGLDFFTDSSKMVLP